MDQGTEAKSFTLTDRKRMTACCSVGARWLAEDTYHKELVCMVTGNDNPYDNTNAVTYQELSGFTVGAAFQEAME